VEPRRGLDVRNEIHGSHGWIGTDETGSMGVQAFALNGWLRRRDDRAGAGPGHAGAGREPCTCSSTELNHFVDCFAGRDPPQALRYGVIDNAVIDTGYRSMASRS